MSILQNAVDSISLGVEDFKSDDSRRLHSSIRNFYAGLLLLFKHRLATLASDKNEALIKTRVRPRISDGRVEWVGKGKRTVDLQEIKERFGSLGLHVDWTAVDSLQKYRNNIEHYYEEARREVVSQQLCRCFLVVSEFIRTQLDEVPHEVLGETVWSWLLEEKAVFDAELGICAEAMGRAEWINETAKMWLSASECPACGSELMRPVDPDVEECSFECSVCGECVGFIELLEETGSPHGSHHAEQCGESSTGICPECANLTYDDVECQCVACGAEGPFVCIRCDCVIPIEELSFDSSMCSWCNHMSSKDD